MIERSVASGTVAMAAFLVWFGSCSCRKAPNSTPPGTTLLVEELQWPGEGEGFAEWGQTTDGFFGLSAPGEALDVWRWHGAALRKDPVVVLPESLNVVPLPDGRWLGQRYPGSDYAPWPLVLSSLTSKEVVRKWDPIAGWGWRHVGVARKGRFAAVTMRDGPGAEGYNSERDRLRIARIDMSELELGWVAELAGDGADSIRRLAVSEDGRYVAVGGWDNGVALADASAGKVTWVAGSLDAVSLGYVVFSSDGEHLYVADAGGGYVYALDTKDGKVLRRWCATEAGKPVCGRRVSCLAVSPDGSWIAAGTGPEGDVYLWNVAGSDDTPSVLRHGRITVMVVSFSPDSQRLASAAGGLIRVWSVPR